MSSRSPRVVFDFGAVLFRWRPGHVIAQVWPEKAATPDDLQRAVTDCFQAYGGDWGLFDQGLIDTAELARRHEMRLGWPAADVRRLVDAAAAELQPQPEVLALLLALKAAGHRTSFLSNMPKPLAESLQRANPLETWFDSGVFSSAVQLCKPDPILFDLAARQFGEAPSDCLLVDDHPANVAAALRAGWQAERFTDAAALARAFSRRGLLAQ